MNLTRRTGGSLVKLIGMNFGRRPVGQPGRWAVSLFRILRGE